MAVRRRAAPFRSARLRGPLGSCPMDFELVRKTLQGQGFMKLIGARVDRVDKGFCELSVDFREELTQQHGFFHGGLTAFLIDNATPAAAGTLVGGARVGLTAGYNLSFLSPVVGGRPPCRCPSIQPPILLTLLRQQPLP